MPERSSMIGRVVVALALTIGFYALALGLAAGLLAFAWFAGIGAHRIDVRLMLLCIVGACTILASVIPRRNVTAPPGPRLEPDAQPRLFHLVEEVARATGEPMPAELFLVPDLNAFVTQRVGVATREQRRVLGIGLPLLQVMTQAELRAVLAHEFGHFKGGDVKLGSWLYSTRAAIERVIARTAAKKSLLRFPFLAYGRLFLRVTHAISRQQELQADELAIRIGGTDAHVSALEKVNALAPAFNRYWRTEVAPLLASGFLPPIADGLGLFLAAPTEQATIAELRKNAHDDDRADPYDTHPSPRRRFEAAKALPRVEATGRRAPARELLDDVAGLERALLARIGRAGTLDKLAPISWSDVAERVIVPSWRRQLEPRPAEFEGATLGDASRLLLAILAAMQDPKAQSAVDRERLRYVRVRAAVGLAFVRAGFAAQTGPGDPVLFVRDGKKRDVYAELDALTEVKPADAPEAETRWRARCAEDHVADLPLLPPA